MASPSLTLTQPDPLLLNDRSEYGPAIQHLSLIQSIHPIKAAILNSGTCSSDHSWSIYNTSHHRQGKAERGMSGAFCGPCAFALFCDANITEFDNLNDR